MSWTGTPDSSNIARFRYDDTTLKVEFKNGATYDYLKVPPEIIAEFRTAESAGKFLNSRVKGKYDFQKV